MPIQRDELQQMLEAKFEDGEIEIQDPAGDGDHYAVTVISSAFEGLSLPWQIG